MGVGLESVNDVKIKMIREGDIVRTGMGHEYQVERIIEGRGLLKCRSLKYPEFDPYFFPVEAIERITAMT